MIQYVCKKPGTEKERIKVLLAYPKVGAEAKMSLSMPLSLLYLAGNLKEYSVAIYDHRVDPIETFEKLLAEKPICVGFSTMTGFQIKFALELAEKAKAAGVPTVFGGVHPTIHPEQTEKDPRVDYVVKGDGEIAFRNIIEALEKNEPIDHVVSAPVSDLNKASDISYDLVDVEQYVNTAFIKGRSLPYLFSRGCPFRCAFCCNPVIGRGQWRRMDVDVAIKQLDELVEKYKLDGIAFLDENLTVQPAVVKEMAEKINNRFKWFVVSRSNSLLRLDLDFFEKKGVVAFSCGLESGSPRMLKLIKKDETIEEFIEANRRLAKTNMEVWYNYIVGFPEETLEDVKLTVKLAMQMLDENPRAFNSTFYLLTPYPGTEIGETYLKDEMPTTLEGWTNFGRHNFTAKWHDPEMLELYKKIYFSSKFVGRRLISVFPDDTELQELAAEMAEKWRNFDFSDEEEWKELTDRGWKVLRRLFGENAY